MSFMARETEMPLPEYLGPMEIIRVRARQGAEKCRDRYQPTIQPAPWQRVAQIILRLISLLQEITGSSNVHTQSKYSCQDAKGFDSTTSPVVETRRISTSSPSNRNSAGKRTAWLLPS